MSLKNFQQGLLTLFLSSLVTLMMAQDLEKVNLTGLNFRSIGPALTSGRIADIAVHPQNRNIYYVATASGGVWKTTNAGTTYTPIFDGQGSYSIGCITIDPNNPNVIWVGTGENNNQRSVSYGDGVYKSEDGGDTWQHVGLKTSEHIGKIIVHPTNSNIVYVAAIGPLWRSGGERGVYKTIDGGTTWEAVLEIDEHTGVTDLIIDPRNPKVLYAAAFQRQRKVFTYVGGGPGSGMYKTIDAGKTWKKINKGLPSVDIGRIGLAISPADPEIIYAIVEAAQGKSGFYQSTNRGASWEKQSSYSTSGNYYSEIVAHPTEAKTIYAMDTWMHFSTDGGKTFNMVGEDYKHVDNHSMWIDPNMPSYFLVGCDGGIYESFDAGKTWVFKANLPVTQFYKVAVDNALPFYNVFGGTQDNFSIGGPSRTRTGHGIMNSDWFITNGGDGFESQVDPKNPNIIYAQAQYGYLVRYDKSSGEAMGIQPKPRKEEAAYRWNWDAPLAVSAHNPTRIYFAANKLFRSDNRGNEWQVISPDLTRQIDRNTLKVMDRVQSIDAVAKNASTSEYGTIVAFSESPKNENLLYVGTDDGLVQVSEDGGKNWIKISKFPNVPEFTYVNAVLASQHDENVVYAAFNNHKNGDFAPYIYKSSDKGKTWKAITANLPEKGSTYSIAEDHVDPNLLFVGTEFGCFFTNSGGNSWKQLKAGLPTIAVRDLAIQTRENDLVLATFGRGFYILDDYSPLRNLTETTLKATATIFPIKDGLIFIESLPLGLKGKSFQGDNFFTAKNPSVGVEFTYYLKEGHKTLKEKRRAAESKAIKNGEPIAYPSYDELKAEEEELPSFLLFVIKDMNGNVVKKLKTNITKGVNRINWDGRYASKNPVDLSSPSFYNPFSDEDKGFLAMPGDYTVTLQQSLNGTMTTLVDAVPFKLKTLGGVTLPATDRKALVDFQQKATDLQQRYANMNRVIGEVNHKIKYIKEAILTIPNPTENLMNEVYSIEKGLAAIKKTLNGDGTASKLDQPTNFGISSRIGSMIYDMWNATSAPTKTQLQAYEIANDGLKTISSQLKKIVETDLTNLENTLKTANAPYTPGRAINWGKE